MLRAYIALAALVLGTFSYAQYQYWSVWGSDAQSQRLSQSGARHK